MEKERIAVITDSGCDLPSEYIKQNEDLYVLPLQLTYVEGTYKSGVDITSEEVFRRMELGEVPTTALPQPEDVLRIFEELERKSITQAVFVMISSGLSGTYNMVRLVCQEQTKIKTQIYDSKILSMGLGYMVMNAVELIKQGISFEKLQEPMKKMRENIDAMFYLPSLEYLIRGGRIGYVVGTVGQFLNAKPIIACNAEGKYYARATCIGAKRTIQTVKRMFGNFVENHKYEVAIIHANVPEEAKRLLDELKSIPSMIAHQILPLSPALFVHVGKGMVAVCARRIPNQASD